MVNLNAFPGCCGVRVLNGFYRDMWNDDDPQLRQIQTQIKKLHAPGLTLAVLNSEQIKQGWHENLLKSDFVVLMDGFLNENHRTKLTLYGRVTRPESLGRKKVLTKSKKDL